MVDRAIPIIDRILRRRCRDWTGGLDLLNDLRSEVLVRLLARLRDSGGGPGKVIENFDGYVAGIAVRVVGDAVRVARPEWMRLKNRVRYLVTHDDRFRLAAGDQLHTVFLVDAAAGAGGARVRTAAAEKLAGNVTEILRGAGDELSLDLVVNALADRCGISNRVTKLEELSIASSGAGPAAQIESADSLRRLWLEITALPPRQRAALLLSARDAGGESALRLFCAASLVSARDAAEALQIAEKEVPSLLDELPLSDAVISRRLHVTVQQVINMRKAARDRLARRLPRPR